MSGDKWESHKAQFPLIIRQRYVLQSEAVLFRTPPACRTPRKHTDVDPCITRDAHTYAVWKSAMDSNTIPHLIDNAIPLYHCFSFFLAPIRGTGT